MGDLTPKQEAFCQEYLVDLNATQAAIRAGYSKKTANKHGPELVVNSGIKKRIKELQDKRAKRVDRTQDSIIKKLETLESKAAEAGQYSVAVRSVELQGKHLGMFGDKLDLNHGVQPEVEQLLLILSGKPIKEREKDAYPDE
jgi:phage terminase small subunit